MSRNKEVASVLNEIAILLEIQGKDKFKPRAYYRAARTVASHGEDIEKLVAEDRVTDIPGVGKGISEVIKDYIRTGSAEIIDNLRKEIPVRVNELNAIPSIGPKKIKLFYETLGVTDIESLEKAIDENKLAGLPGMGERSVEQIVEGIALVRAGMERSRYADVLPVANRLLELLKGVNGVRRAEVAGSFRRKRETVGDLDILVDATESKDIMEAFVSIEGVADVMAQGTTKSSIRLESNLQVDLRVIPEDSFGAGLQYFTGNIDHNVSLRSLAIKKGFKLNEYGLFKGDEKVAGREEEEIYAMLGIPWIPPELREGRGEIEAALDNNLPKLISLEDIRGDLHTHTDQSDGVHTIEQMLDAAEGKGYEYYCISDHTQSLTIANGMDEQRLLKRLDEIDDLNASGRWDLRILKGAEVDILANGDLDIKDEVLSQLDVVTVSIHSRMKDSKKVMTERVCTALQNRYVHILGHPTGRLINRRHEFEIDLGEIFEVAKANNIAMELNAHPSRLDLDDGNLRVAIGMGIKVAINTDAHRIEELDNMIFGVNQARRGWVTKEDVLNTASFDDLTKWLGR